MNDYDIAFEWGDGSGDRLYLKLEASGEIGVYSDVNNTMTTRTKNITFNGSQVDLEEGQQAKAILHVVQQINSLVVATFENTVSVYTNIGSGNYDNNN